MDEVNQFSKSGKPKNSRMVAEWGKNKKLELASLSNKKKKKKVRCSNRLTDCSQKGCSKGGKKTSIP